MTSILLRASADARRKRRFGLLTAGLLSAAASWAQNAAMPPAPSADGPASWRQCQRLAGDDAARLSCYDRWAGQQTPPADAQPALPALVPTQPIGATPTPPDDASASTIVADDRGCRDPRYSGLSRFWELEKGSDCGAFGLRGYRPLSIAFAIADGRPETPTSPSPRHTGVPQSYQPGEMRINLSLRTKLAHNLLTRDTPDRSDSLWFGYSLQSAWQVFNPGLSRPFRATDHEPELIYVYPVDMSLAGGWRWRYAGLGVVHQSNGQSLPLSRSWNRAYLMGGIELDDRWRFTARAWQRISEKAADDDNPDIAHYIGRAELAGWWTPDKKSSYGITWRTLGRGSVRLEWLRALGRSPQSNLRLHLQLFHGYGDTLLDYNRRRTVLGIGLSLVDF